MKEYVGNLHVHTTYSDGTKSVEGVAEDAARAGLDFVMLSDHHTLAPKLDGKEGMHHGVLMLVGMEVGTAHNHYLAWRVDEVVEDDQENPQSVIDGVSRQGGIGFIAHPFEEGCKYAFSGRAFTWNDWHVTGYTGICIWNFTSQWKAPVKSMASGIFYYLYRRGAVRAPDKYVMSAWDSELVKRKVVAIGGTDAHGFRFGFGQLKVRIFPYRYLFRTINTHILTSEELTGELGHDRDVVYSAIERGNCFVGYDLLGDTRGFRFEADSGAGRAIMGDEISLNGSVRFTVRPPRHAYIRVLRDGIPWREGEGGLQIFTTNSPGVYRVEVYKQNITGQLRAWVFSNPIYVRP